MTQEGATTPGLQLQYRLRTELNRLRIPAPQSSGPADNLWQHCCFEAFVGVCGEAAYREFNFSPSGQWAAYHFSNRRQRDLSTESAVPAPPLVIDRHASDHTLEIKVCLPPQALPEPHTRQPWALGLSAVIETREGELSYWALRHPTEHPDFHHRDGWHILALLPHMLLSTHP